MYKLYPDYLQTVVITEEELAKWKSKQHAREVQALEELIEGHRKSIAQLQTTITRISEENSKVTE